MIKIAMMLFFLGITPPNMLPTYETPQENQTNISLEETIQKTPYLQKGDAIKPFVVEDVKGNTIALKRMLRKNKVLLVFLRHAWCPVCNYRTHELIANYSRLKEEGYEVVVIYESKKSSLLPYVEDHNLPYTVIADPERKLYTAFKVEFSQEKMMKSRENSTMLKHYKEGMRLFGSKKYPKGEGEEKSTIIPADFIVGKDRKIEMAYYGAYIGDHYPIKDVLTSMGGNSSKDTKGNTRF